MTKTVLIAQSAGLAPTLLGVDAAAPAADSLGRQQTFLYFSKDDLTVPARRAVAERLIQRHFR